MDQIRSLDRKHLFGLIILLVLLIAIPLIMYLIRQQQVLKSRANESQNVQFVGTGVTPAAGGNPASTGNSTVSARLIFQVPTLTQSATRVIAVDAGNNVSVTWTGLTPDSTSTYFIGSPAYSFGGYGGGFTPIGVWYLTGGNCDPSNSVTRLPPATPQVTGTCLLSKNLIPSASGSYTLGKLKKRDGRTTDLLDDYLFATIAGSAPVTVAASTGSASNGTTCNAQDPNSCPAGRTCSYVSDPPAGFYCR